MSFHRSFLSFIRLQCRFRRVISEFTNIKINTNKIEMYKNYEGFATKLMLATFKLMGLAPFAVEISTVSKLLKNKNCQKYSSIRFSSSRLGCLYNMILIVVQCCILYTAIPMAALDKYPFRSTMTMVIGVSTCILGNSTLFVIYLILGFRQKFAVRLLNRLMSVECTITDRDCISSRHFFFFNFLANIVIWIVIIVSRGITYRYPVISYFRVSTPTMIIAWFITQYTFVIKLIYYRLKAVNRALLDHRNRSTVTNDLSSNDKTILEITTLRQMHTNIYEIATEVSNFYSIPILLAISHFCFIFVYSAYFVVVPCIVVVKLPSGIMITHSIFIMIASLQPIVVLALGITNFTAEMKQTADCVNKLLICSSIDGIERIKIKEFARSLMHRSVRFTACRLFSLDCTLVRSILSVVTTYLIIIIQHQMSVSTKTVQQQINNSTNLVSNHSEYLTPTNANNFE